MLAALSPAALASLSARHPWRIILAWVAALVLGGIATVMFLFSALTSGNEFTTAPESVQAQSLINERFFPPGPQPVTEILYIHSPSLTVDDPTYRAFVEGAYTAIIGLGTGVIADGTTYYVSGQEGMVSLDRRSTALVFTMIDDYPERANRTRYLQTAAGLAGTSGFEVYPVRAPTSGPIEAVIVESDVHTVNSPEFRGFVDELLLDIVRLGRGAVGGAATYYATGDQSLASADGTATIIPIRLNDSDAIEDVFAIVDEARASADFDVHITGPLTVDHDFTELSERDLQQGELRYGLPAAIIVLILVFGAVVAALVPLIAGLVSIGVALGLAGLVATTMDLSNFVMNMIFMMGLAVGIDYGLFIIARFREERANGHDVAGAIARTGATASRAVLFSGVTVVLALIGLLFIPVSIFVSLGLGAILAVVVSIVASLTLVPAILMLLGDRINALRIPLVGRRDHANRPGGLWERIARAVMRAPILALVLAVGVLVALAAPVLDLKTGAAGVSSFPESFESRGGFEVLQEKFSAGLVTPTNVVIDADIADPAVRAAVDTLTASMEADPNFGPVTEQVAATGDTVWLQTLVTTGDETSEEAIASVTRLRNEYIPQAVDGVSARALVGGETASNIDWFAAANDAAPIVFPFVLILSFILLMLVFRSVVIPLNAILMNLLSVGAAYGLLVIVFQWGVGNELFGFQQVDTVEAWIPVFLFSVLFGLSMDYHVFLLSRIRENYVETGDNRGSIAFGVRSTGRLITGAALIMVAVFGGFASGEMVMFEQMGFGLAVAVLLDATIVRSVLVPASMSLIGRWNWYLPGFLTWLPKLNIEGGPEPERMPAE